MKLVQESCRYWGLPVFGNGSDIASGALVMRGATPATNTGTLILATDAGSNPIGALQELHDYSVSGDTNTGGTVFVPRGVEFLEEFPLWGIEYSLSSSDLITCTAAVTTTTMTVTSLEDDIDGAFIYVVSGTGAGQTNFLTASAAGSCTLKAAFATSLDTTSKFIKILPRFHYLTTLTSDGTSLKSQAAAGSGKKIMIIDNQIYRGQDGWEQLDPTKHAALTGLNNGTIRFRALCRITEFNHDAT